MENIKKGAEQKLYQGTFISLNKVEMHFPNQKTAEWDLIHHNGASGMLAVCPDGKILMIHQYRPGEDRVILEIPAGGINPGEAPKSAAIREMEEETGAICAEVHHLITVMPSPAYNDEKVTVYYGKIKEFTETHPDDNEFITIEAFSLEELVRLIMSGEIRDSKTIAAIFAYKELTTKQ